MALGPELQSERERRQISLASIAEVTKVPHRYLLALETGRFDVLPGGILTKGILRGYCRHLGLNEEEWLGKMPSGLIDGTAPEWTQFAENVGRSRVQSAPRMHWRWWGLLLMITALAVAAWGVWILAIRPPA